MKASVWSIAAVFFLLLMGCSSIQTSEPIPVPATTPFDRSPMMRMAYLEAYRDGYRAVANETLGAVEVIRGPYPFARELGWRAGAAAARSASGVSGQKITR